MARWGTRLLGDIAKVTMGQSPPGSLVTRRKAGLPFLQGNAQFGPRWPTATFQCEEAPRRSVPGDSLVSVRAPVGEINRSDCSYGIGRGLAAVSFSVIHPDFGHYALVEESRNLHRVSQGTTFPAIDQTDLAALMMPVPPLEEQRRIAEILDTIDEAIQATERVIAKRTAIRSGLAADLLYRISTMDDCEELPLGEVFDVQLGKMLGAGSRHGDQFQYLANRNVQWGRIVIDELGTMNFNIGERTRYRLQSGDLLVCEGGEVGRAAIWSDELPECYFQNAIHRLRAISDADPRYMRHYFEFAAMVGSLRALTGQTSIGHLPRANLVRWLVPMPPLEEQRRIAEILDTADEAIRVHERERDKLKQLRSGLADDLLSGRVRTVAS